MRKLYQVALQEELGSRCLLKNLVIIVIVLADHLKGGFTLSFGRGFRDLVLDDCKLGN